MAVALFDRDMRYLAVTRRWLTDYGLDGQNLIGRSHHEVLPDLPARWKDAHRRALGGEAVQADVDRFDREDGSTWWVRWDLRPWYDEAGGVGGVVLVTENETAVKRAEESRRVGQDVTERRQADEELRQSIALRRHAEAALRLREESLRAILDAATDAIISIDDTGAIHQVNAATARLFGYPPDELLGRNVSALMPSPYREEHDGYIARYLRTGEKRVIGIGREVVARRKDGTTFPIELSMREAAGPPRRFIGFVRDITDRKELEARFLRAQRLESIGTLASGIAHDLNNVLTPVLVAVKLLLRDRPGLDRTALLETAQASIERGAGMIRQLLTFGGGMTGERVPVAVGELVREVKGLLDHALPKTIAFTVAVGDPLWPVVGDPTQLTQVLVNLCVNGRDAMPAGGALTIRVENRTLDPERAARHPGARPGRYVHVAVSDTGTGMTPEVQARIFDPFFTTKPFGEGTGLGLATAQGIVKSHGGFVGVYSEPGRGTRFSVFLPAAGRPADAAPSPQT